MIASTSSVKDGLHRGATSSAFVKKYCISFSARDKLCHGLFCIKYTFKHTLIFLWTKLNFQNTFYLSCLAYIMYNYDSKTIY